MLQQIKKELSNKIHLSLEETSISDRFDIDYNFTSILNKLKEIGIQVEEDWIHDHLKQDDYGDNQGLSFRVAHIKIKYKDVDFLATFGVQYVYEYDGVQVYTDNNRTFSLLNLEAIQDIEEMNKKNLEKITKDPIKLFGTLLRLNI